MTSRCRFAVPLAMLLVPWGRAPLDAGSLRRLDLASLYAEADLIVLVENFQPGEKNQPGRGLVKKLFKGDFELGGSICVTPWAVDFKRASGVPGGQLEAAFTAVFFLKRQSAASCWDTVLSGVRVLIEDRIFAVQPAGSTTYVVVPAKAELLEEAEPYDRENFQRDVEEASGRLDALEEALVSHPSEAGLEKLRSVLESELQRTLQAAAHSEWIVAIAQRLAEVGELEALWELRGRVQGSSMHGGVERIFARECTYAFVKERLRAEPGSAEFNGILDFLRVSSFPIEIDVKVRALGDLIAMISSFNERVGSTDLLARIYRTAAALYDDTAAPLDEALLRRIVELARSGGPLARYYLRPVLVEREPDLAGREFDEPFGVFALVHLEAATRTTLKGRVQFRRLASQNTFEDPTITFQRRTTDGQTLDHFTRCLALPANALKRGASGEFSTGFSWGFKRTPLSSGEWRIFLTLTSTTGGGSQRWSTDPLQFRIRD